MGNIKINDDGTVSPIDPTKPSGWGVVPISSKVNVSECMLWAGKKESRGYGVWGKRGAHRVAYELLVGEIPEGLELDHLCRVRCCINPEHLEPVTHAENNFRRRNKICRNGHEYTAENEYWYVDLQGYPKRKCKPCNSEQKRRSREEAKAS